MITVTIKAVHVKSVAKKIRCFWGKTPWKTFVNGCLVQRTRTQLLWHTMLQVSLYSFFCSKELFYAGYDSQFILSYLEKQAIKPKIITSGLRIICLEACSIKLIDSLQFLNMPLSAVPKAFGIDGSKGYFPHFFNTMSNWNYDGPLPEKRFL